MSLRDWTDLARDIAAYTAGIQRAAATYRAEQDGVCSRGLHHLPHNRGRCLPCHAEDQRRHRARKGSA